MQTLSYGYLKPETADPGVLWFPALDVDIQRLNDHTHNGTDSARLDTTSIASIVQAILAAGWTATTGGTYRQAVTVPAGITFGACGISFYLTASGNPTYPVLEKISSTSYYIYTNDNSLAYTAVYVS